MRFLEAGNKTQAHISKEFITSKQTIPNYAKSKGEIVSACKASHGKGQKNDNKGAHPKLEEALKLWLKNAESSKLPNSSDVVKEKAETTVHCLDIENFNTVSCSRNSAVRGVPSTRQSSPTPPLRNLDCSPDDILRFDQTALFHKLLPDRTFAGRCLLWWQEQQRANYRHGWRKHGWTENSPILVVNKPKNPRCFKGTKSPPAERVESLNRFSKVTEGL